MKWFKKRRKYKNMVLIDEYTLSNLLISQIRLNAALDAPYQVLNFDSWYQAIGEAITHTGADNLTQLSEQEYERLKERGLIKEV